MSGNDSGSYGLNCMMALFGAGAAVAAFCGSRVLTKPAVKEPRNKAQSLNDYKKQMQTEVAEIDEIIEQLNYFTASSKDTLVRLLKNNFDNRPILASQIKESSKVELPADFVRLQEQTRELHNAIKNYPILEDGQKVSCNSLRAFCMERAEYHQKVKGLARVVFEESNIQLRQDVLTLEEEVSSTAIRHL